MNPEQWNQKKSELGSMSEDRSGESRPAAPSAVVLRFAAPIRDLPVAAAEPLDHHGDTSWNPWQP